ncbi:MAG: hypothetical protein ACRDJ2_11215 [Actinomycetota bacterium]
MPAALGMEVTEIDSDSGHKHRGGRTLLLRLAALAVVASSFMPTYTSVGNIEPELDERAESDAYLGNPLPLADWIVAGVALFTAFFAPRLATAAATLALFSLGFTAFSALADAGSGPSVSVEFGLPLGAAAAGLLLWAGVRLDRDRRA